MGLSLQSICCIVSGVLVLLFPALQGFVTSRAAYYGSPHCSCASPAGTPNGACGYGEYGSTMNDANVAGVSNLFKDGLGCGACYQVRCKAPQCTDEGVNIVVTDHASGGNTDFILSESAYGRMARPNMAAELYRNGSVEIEYQRIPCRYAGDKIIVHISEQRSKFPNYLVIVILYQAGKYDILAAAISQEKGEEWIEMRRAQGAVFDLANPPKGSLSLRLKLSSDSEGVKWMKASNIIPSDWKVGHSYHSIMQPN